MLSTAFCASTKVKAFTKTVKVMILQVCRFFVSVPRNTVIQRVLLVHAFKLCKSTEMVSVSFGSSYFAVRDGNGSSYEKK